MWIVVYMSQNKLSIDNLRVALEAAGILLKVRPVNKSGSSSDECFELLVPESEVNQAHEIIIEQGF